MNNKQVLTQSDPILVFPAGPSESVRLKMSMIPSLIDDTSGNEYLAVFVKNETAAYSQNAIQGRYSIQEEYLVFSPYFPFEKDLTYVVRTKCGATNGYSYQSFQLETTRKIDPAKVKGIYPSGDQLPENLLRFYIYFNTPMKNGEVLKHIYLTDAEGNIDHHAFMEFKQELWSSDRKRLTILFDPGRIKRGVSANVDFGPALLAGRNYSLIISGEWRDVHGQTLQAEIRKEFKVLKAYRKRINTVDWKVTKPAAHSYGNLEVQFDRVMDHALIQSMIQLEDEENNLIDGHWEILEGEQRIQFIPEAKWQKGNYQIVFDSRLEDVAGNNLNSLLDESVAHKQKNREASNLKFIIK